MIKAITFTASFIAACARMVLIVAVVGITPLAVADRAVPQRQKQPEAYQERLVEWLLEDPDGFFHPSIVWRRLGPDGKSGPYAMHATEDIPGGTPLIVLPRKYVLESGVKEGIQEYVHERVDPRLCLTVQKIWDEHFVAAKTGESSFYAPYLSYLFDDTAGGTTRGLLPTSWSEHSQNILSLILGEEEGKERYILTPHAFEYTSIWDFCTNEVMDIYEEHFAKEAEYEETGSGEVEYEETESEKTGSRQTESGEAEYEETGPGETVSGEVEYEETESEEAEYQETESEETRSGQTESGEAEYEETDQEETEYEDWEEEVYPNMTQNIEDAYIFLMSRGWYDKLLPVVDMLNHRNGPWRNVEVTTINDEDGKDIAAYAWRDISKGEQLQYTYSECMDETCNYGGAKYGFSTQHIFSDYGFLELYPQRWTFSIHDENSDDEEEYAQTLYAEVTTNVEDETKLIFRWIFYTPTDASIAWIRKQLARLKSIESQVRTGVDELERVLLGEDHSGTTIHNIEHERESLLEFYDAYVRVFELALEHKDDPVSLTWESFEEDLEAMKAVGWQKTIEEIRKHELLAKPTAPRTAPTDKTKPSADEF